MTIYLPEKCLRGRSDCRPLSQVAADDETSFFCCGANDIATRKVPDDAFTLCFKNDDIDERTNWDRRDMLDQASVIAQALSIDENSRVAGAPLVQYQDSASAEV